MTIKKVSIEDLGKVVTLFDLYRQFYNQKSDVHSAEKFLSERIRNNESIIFLATEETGNLAIGFVQLYPLFSSVGMKPVWLLNDLYVHSDYRKQGVAEALIKISAEFAKKTNSSGIILETQISNVNAQKLYDKLGFKRDEEHYYYSLELEN